MGFSRLARAQKGYRPLVLNALDYALAGQTTLADVLALSGQVEDLRFDAAAAATDLTMHDATPADVRPSH